MFRLEPELEQMGGQMRDGARDCVRFGFTVGRRQARLAVQRALVKRVLREAARNAAGTLRPLVLDRSVDIVLRLRSPLPDRCQMSRDRLKRALRSEADSLMAQLARHLRSDTP
jgi:ribonuclease P protein component